MMKHDEPTYKSMWSEVECPSCAAKDLEIKRLREAVEWRSVYPTCEGYWWHRGPSGTIMRRVRMAPMPVAIGLGPYDADMNESLWDIDGEWAGPIPVPAELRRRVEGGK